LYSEKKQERLNSYLNIHLKKEEMELAPADQIEALQRRDRAKWWHLAINSAAILFFGYSFYYNITELSRTFFLIIFGVFGVNVGLILYQKKQIGELIEYLEWKQKQ